MTSERTPSCTRLGASRMGLGLAALGRPGYINLGHGSDLAGRTDEASMEQGAHVVLDAAYASGVRYFDAARSYGRAEAFLSDWLDRTGIAASDVTVGSKWGYTYTADWRVDATVHEVKELSLANLRRQLAESQELLGAPPAPLPNPFRHDRQRGVGRSGRRSMSWPACGRADSPWGFR